MNENNLQFNVIFKSEPEGGFTASVPSLPGCISFGRDLIEAKKMIVDAIKAYIISLKKHKEIVVSDKENFMSLISINQELVAHA